MNTRKVYDELYHSLELMIRFINDAWTLDSLGKFIDIEQKIFYCLTEVGKQLDQEEDEKEN